MCLVDRDPKVAVFYLEWHILPISNPLIEKWPSHNYPDENANFWGNNGTCPRITPLENIAWGKYGTRKSKHLNAKEHAQTFSSQSIFYKMIRQLSESLLS